MNGNGLSAGDVLALTKDNGGFLGGEGIWGIIMLLIIAGLFSGNGFGWGNRGAVAETDIDTRFLERDIFNTNQNVSNTACQTQRDVLETKYDLGTQILENRFNCSQNACATQKEILQSRYDNALQNQTIQSQIADCCCTLESKIIEENQKTRDMIQQDKIDQLREQVNTSNLALFGQNIVNQILPRSVPAYPSCSPYVPANYGYNNCGNTLY